MKKKTYNIKNKSLLHQFLKEEGFTLRDLSDHLGLCRMSLDKYLNNPQEFRIKHINEICSLTGVDSYFILDILKNNDYESIR